ncbi:hypothetical protein [Ochrovirga pacifica]|uniref:hypothetical protein n=1 Tax=Ochrovirga pacifica TaxID=1042376 RepID=UPI0002559B2F|nr:hypothetical protein [Ochrovirga pacifica]
MGNYLGMFWDVNYIYKDKYSFTIAQQLQLNYANQRPDDMVSSEDWFNFDLDVVLSHRLLVGRIYNFDKNRRSRLNLQVGLAYNLVEEPKNYRKTRYDEVR